MDLKVAVVVGIICFGPVVVVAAEDDEFGGSQKLKFIQSIWNVVRRQVVVVVGLGQSSAAVAFCSGYHHLRILSRALALLPLHVIGLKCFCCSWDLSAASTAFPLPAADKRFKRRRFVVWSRACPSGFWKTEI